MKTKLQAIFFLMVGGILVVAANVSGEDALMVDPSGKVGIGVTSPQSKLTVNEPQESTTKTLFTQAVDRAGILIRTEYTAGAYTPGLFWVTSNESPTKPKAGIFLYEDSGGTDMYLGTSITYATGITNDGIVINQYGRVGIGNPSPSYTLDVTGNIHCTGKLSSDGGNDPPYVLYNSETRKSIVARVIDEVPPDKLGGAVVFFNGETSQMEIFLPDQGEFRSLLGERLASVGPITSTFEVEDRYYFDRKTGEVGRYQVRKVPEEKYGIKEGYNFDPKTGAFYRILRNESGEETRRVPAPREEAVELIPASGN